MRTSSNLPPPAYFPPQESKAPDRAFQGSSIPDLLTLIPRSLYSTVRTLAALPIFAIASLFHKSSFSDPKKITNKKIPIILIHGSGSNQRQWEIFRRFLGNEKCGHIFSLNLSEKAFVNDAKTVEEFAQIRLAKKIESLKERYLTEANLRLDEVILVGHSMGGMVAGEYAVNYASDVSVKAIVSLNTPWKGSSLANWVYPPTNKPGAAFRTDNQESKNLHEKLMQKEREGSLKLFTVSSSLDPLVRPESSSLDLKPENQIFSKVQDHYSAMVDPWLPKDIRDRWIVPISTDLTEEKSE